MMGFFIEVANLLVFKLRDFSGAMMLHSALRIAPIMRLKDHFVSLSRKHRKLDEEVQKMLTAERGFLALRRHMEENASIPYLGILLTDLTFIFDGNPSGFKDGLLWYRQAMMQGSIIESILKMQQELKRKKPFPHDNATKIIKCYLKSIPQISEEVLYQTSLKIQPRAKK